MYKVLLVDDEPMITRGLRALLNWEDYGFEVVSIAENGVEAESYIMENKIDLLITDIMMPKMNGLELIERIKTIQPQVKSIILSGYQEFDYVRQGMRLGIENYLLKPVDEDELIRSVQAVKQKLDKSLVVPAHPEFTTLKDNTLWRLLNGEINKADWQERLSLYDMDYTKPFYSVSILHFERELDGIQSKQVREYIEGNHPVTCFYNSDQELIIIFEANEEKGIDTYNSEITNEYLQKIQDKIGNYYLSVGNPVSSMERLEDSYITARRLTLYQVALEPNIMITQQTNIDKRQFLKIQQEIKDDLAKCLLQSEDAALQGIERFLDHLKIGRSYISHIVVRKFTIDLISYIHHSVQIDAYYNHTRSIEKLIYAVNIDQIVGVLKDYCTGLIDTIGNQSDTRSPIVKEVVEYMHANYNQELSLKTLSQRFYVNPIYLGQLFQKELGIVFSEYMNHFRLEKAKRLLKTTHFGAGDIGKQVGYSDTAYFYRQFKRNVGATPTEWRNI